VWPSYDFIIKLVRTKFFISFVYTKCYVYIILFTIFVVARLTPLRGQHKNLTHNRPLSLDIHSGSINLNLYVDTSEIGP
jgi:hypothetical protein